MRKREVIRAGKDLARAQLRRDTLAVEHSSERDYLERRHAEERQNASYDVHEFTRIFETMRAAWNEKYPNDKV